MLSAQSTGKTYGLHAKVPAARGTAGRWPQSYGTRFGSLLPSFIPARVPRFNETPGLSNLILLVLGCIPSHRGVPGGPAGVEVGAQLHCAAGGAGGQACTLVALRGVLVHLRGRGHTGSGEAGQLQLDENYRGAHAPVTDYRYMPALLPELARRKVQQNQLNIGSAVRSVCPDV